MAENNVKCGEVIIFAHKFYIKKVSFKCFPAVEILSKTVCPGVGFLHEKLVTEGSARGGGGGVKLRRYLNY